MRPGSEPKSPRVLTVADARSMASAIAPRSDTSSRVMSRTPVEAFARAFSAAAAAAS